MNNFFKKFISSATIIAMTASSFLSGAWADDKENVVSAAFSDCRFDFGNKGVAGGFIGVSASDGYNSSRGYGFNTPGEVSDVSASGANELSDAVRFNTTNRTNTFKVDLESGLYKITVNLGNTSRASVVAEDVLQLINLTGNNATDSFIIPVTDGQLSLMVTEGKVNTEFSLSSLIVEKISADTTLPQTIWLCGDSTVCNYYPLETSQRVGWGQVFGEYISSEFMIRNLAASGQYAAGFVNAGQFEPVLKYGKEGDFYFISIGINDTNYSNSTEYYNVVSDMTKKAKEKGITVILVKQQGRSDDISRDQLLTGRYFGDQLDKIGQEQNVQVVDLFNLAQNYFLSIGQTKTTALYDNDKVHFNREGARVLARLVSENVSLVPGDANTQPPAVTTSPYEDADIDTNELYMIKNVNSGQYLDVEDGGSNVRQMPAVSADNTNTWKLAPSVDGYYYLYSQTSEDMVLDVAGKKTVNGTNILVYTYNGNDNQQFRLTKNSDGSYKICTKITGDKSCIEVVDALTENGANVQQYEINGFNCQDWIFEVVSSEPPATTPPDSPLTQQIYGDLNGDNKVDLTDLTLLSLHFIGDKVLTSEKLIAADVDGSNEVDIADLATMKQYISKESVGLIGTAVNGGSQQTTPSQPQSPVTYPAVDALLYNAFSEDINEGFQSSAYVNFENQKGSSIEWTVDVQNTANYLVNFKIANGSANDRAMKIEVNGDTNNYWIQPFLTTGAWTKWETRGIVLPLKAGANKIKAISETVEGGPNIDFITLEETDEPIAEIYQPTLTPDEPSSSNPVIYIAGDSTVQSYNQSYAPQQGWGYYLSNYFNSNVTVSNHAIAGRSSKSFYDNGRLDTILNQMKQGDYLLVQFGINDAGYTKEERYAPVCGSVTNPTDGSFEYYMKKYVEGTLEKGGTPILITTVIGLKAYSNGKFVNSYDNYCKATKDIAAYYNVPCIDLNSLMVSHYNAIGYDAAKLYHLYGVVEGSTDMTHFSEKGADTVAGIVADAIKKAGIPLSQSVK